MAHQPETNASFPDPQNPQDQQGTTPPTQRPADGARIVSPGHMSNAPTPGGSGDFLNLDHKGSSDQAAPDGSWLMDGGTSEGQQAMSQQPMSPQGMQPASMPEGMQQAPAPESPQQGTWLLDEASEAGELPAITSDLTGMPEEPIVETSWSEENAGPSFGSRWAPRLIAMAMAGAAGAMGIVYMDGMQGEGAAEVDGPTVMAPTESLTRSTELVGVEAPMPTLQDTPRIIRRATPEPTGTEREPGELSIWASTSSADDGDEENHLQGGPEADLAASTLAALDALMADPNADIDGKVVLLEDEPTVAEPEQQVEITVAAQPDAFWLASLAQPSLVESQTPFEVVGEGTLVDLDRGPMASITDIGPITIETEVLAHSPANVPPMEFQPQLYMWPIGFLTSYEIQFQSMQDSNQGSTLALEPDEVTFTDEVVLMPVESTEVAMPESPSTDFDESLASADSEVAHIEIVMAPADDEAAVEPVAVDVLADELADERDSSEVATEETETVASLDPTEVDPGQVGVESVESFNADPADGEAVAFDLTDADPEDSDLADASEAPTATGPGVAEVLPFGEMPEVFDAETPNLDLEPEFFELADSGESVEFVTPETPLTDAPEMDAPETDATAMVEAPGSEPSLFDPSDLDPMVEGAEFDTLTDPAVAAADPSADANAFVAGEPEGPALEDSVPQGEEIQPSEFEFNEFQVHADELAETSTDDFPQLEPWQVFLEPDADVFPFHSEPEHLEFDLMADASEVEETSTFDGPAPLDPATGPNGSSDEVPEPGTSESTDLVAADVDTGTMPDDVDDALATETDETSTSPEVSGMLERLADPALADLEDTATEDTATEDDLTAAAEVAVPEFDVTSTGSLEPVAPEDDLLQAFADFTDGDTELTPVHDWPEPTTDVATTQESTPAKPVGILNRVDTGRQWTRRNPPEHLMDGDKRMTTPNVGAVRVTLTAGDVFEGKLVAVGKGLVELETKIGSLTLGSARVAKIARLDPSQLDDSGTKSRDGGLGSQTRVRVKAPGGVFTGRQIARNGNEVTLITDQGLRITLVSDDIEEFGTQKRVGLRRRGEETTVIGPKVEDVEPDAQDAPTDPTPKDATSEVEFEEDEVDTTPEAAPDRSSSSSQGSASDVAPGDQPPAGWEN